MKAHGKGTGITINAGGTNNSVKWKQMIANATVGIPEREWNPLKITRAMEIAVERCKELTAIPSRFA